MIQLTYEFPVPVRDSSDAYLARCRGLWSACLLAIDFVGPVSADATPAAPHLSKSWYIATSSTTTAYNDGCADGSYDVSKGYTSRIEILDFGGQVTGGTELPRTKIFISYSQIEAVAEQFAYGYYLCTSTSQYAFVYVSTNNSLNVSSSWGDIWGNVRDQIVSSTVGQEVSSYVSWRGGNDIESWSPSTSAVDAEHWAQGYTGSTGGYYIDFGSANGCSESAYSDNNGHGIDCSAGFDGGTNTAFTQNSYWYLSWGESSAQAAPEVYASGQAQEWTQICRFGGAIKGSSISFTGPLTDIYLDSSSYTAGQTWSAFYNALSSTSCAQTPGFEIAQVSE